MERADCLPTTIEPPPCALGRSKLTPSQGQAPSSTINLLGKLEKVATYRFWDCFCKTVSRAEARAGPLAPTDVAHNAKSPRQQETLPAPFCYNLLLFN